MGHGTRQTSVGQVALDQTSLTVQTATGSLTIPRADIVSLAPGAAREANYWTANASIGLHARTGNTDQVDLNTNLTVQRLTPANRLYLNALSNFSRTGGVESANDHRVTLVFDSFLNTRWFFRPVQLEYFRDPFQNIANRYYLSPSLGYRLIKNPKTAWDLTGGPGYQVLQFLSVPPGATPEEEAYTRSLATHFATEITPWFDLNGSYELRYARKESGGYSFHSITTGEFALTRTVDLDISLLWDWMQNPFVDSAGEEPKNHDFRLIFGVGIDL